nr:DNA polymerase IV [Actinomycetota bacterium]
SRSRADLEEALRGLADRVTQRMQRKGRAGRTIVLRLRFGDYSRATRSCTLPYPTSDAPPVAAAALGLLEAAMPVVERRGITLVGLTVTNLGGPATGEQLALPLEDD